MFLALLDTLSPTNVASFVNYTTQDVEVGHVDLDFLGFHPARGEEDVSNDWTIVIFWQVHIYDIICYNLVLLHTFMMKPTQRLRQQAVGMPSLSLHSIEDVVPMPFCASCLLWDVDAFSIGECFRTQG